MASGQLTGLLHHIEHLVGRSVSAERSDGELLEQYVTQQSETAFSALVRRHGALVWRVCRRVLNDRHTAEDAFQATFVVLARKAAALRRHEALASWLYGVALRVAGKARVQGVVRHQTCTPLPTELPAATPAEDDPWLRQVLDEELVRLSDKFRAPLVLCYLEGKTYGQAARELGWSEGSMSRRLAQAREQLRQRLARRGVVLGGAGLAAVLETEAYASLPAGLIEGTVQSALNQTATTVGAVAGGSGSAVTLAKGVLRDMSAFKFKSAAAALLACGLAVSGMDWFSRSDEPLNQRLTQLIGTTAGEGDFVPDDVEPVDCPQENARAEAMLDLGEAMAFFVSDGDPEPSTEIPPELRRLPPGAKIAIKRRNLKTEEELRRYLQQLTELKLESDDSRKNSKAILAGARELLTSFERRVADTTANLARGEAIPAQPAEPKRHFGLDYLADRRDLIGLPLLRGAACELDAERVAALQAMSRQMRQVVGEAAEGTDDPEGVAIALRLNFRLAGSIRNDPVKFKDHFLEPKSIPTMMQMLPGEHASVRRVLVEQLDRIDDPASTQALARLAAFDISPEVRASAIEVLMDRPASDYRPVLVEALRYPWSAVADHAAEALVALQDKGAVPALRQLVDQPDPNAPFVDPATKTLVAREIVQVNHLRNCLMCHAPSVDGGRVVAPVPEPDKPLPPASLYYAPQGDILVRADVTYLRQDFSVAQPVAKAAPWPDMQRYDYFVRLRPVETSVAPAAPGASYPQRDAVLFALKELQGP